MASLSKKKKKVRIDSKQNEVMYFNTDRFALVTEEIAVPKEKDNADSDKKLFPSRTRYVVYKNLIGHSIKYFGQPSVRMDICIVTVDLNKTNGTAGRYFAPAFKYIFKKHLKNLQVEDAILCAARDAQISWNETQADCLDLCAYTVAVVDKQYSGRGFLLNLGNLVGKKNNEHTCEYFFDEALYNAQQGHVGQKAAADDKNYNCKSVHNAHGDIDKDTSASSANAGRMNAQFHPVYIEKGFTTLQHVTNKKAKYHSLSAFGCSNFGAGDDRTPKLYILKNISCSGISVMNSAVYMMVKCGLKDICSAQEMEIFRTKLAKKHHNIAVYLPNPFVLHLSLRH
jgi:hypothetical protein